MSSTTNTGLVLTRKQARLVYDSIQTALCGLYPSTAWDAPDEFDTIEIPMHNAILKLMGSITGLNYSQLSDLL